MISPENQKYILQTVKNLINECLLESGFDPTVKEPGHSYGEKVEEILAEKLCQKDSRFSMPVKIKGKGKQTRQMGDLIWENNNLINIKLGYEKGDGQPNMVSFNRLLKKFVTNEIDSYYILMIDVSGKIKNNLITNFYFFNLYDYLDYVHYNYGTGQVMLKEKQFFSDYDSNKYFNNSKKDIMRQLKEIDEIAFQSHLQLKQKQHQSRQEIFDEYC
jgi:hypothetical protein